MPEALHFNWVKQTVVGTPGTGNITLGPAAAAGFLRIQDMGLALNTSHYLYVSIQDGNNREAGIAEYSSNGTTATLTRWTVGGAESLNNGTYSPSPSTPLALTSAAIVFCAPLSMAMQSRFYGGLYASAGTQSIPSSTSTYVTFSSSAAIHHNNFGGTITGGYFQQYTPVARKVMLHANIRFVNGGTATQLKAEFHVNGAPVPGSGKAVINNPSASNESILVLNSGPIILPINLPAGNNPHLLQVSVFHDSGSAINIGGDSSSHFFGYHLIGS